MALYQNGEFVAAPAFTAGTGDRERVGALCNIGKRQIARSTRHRIAGLVGSPINRRLATVSLIFVLLRGGDPVVQGGEETRLKLTGRRAAGG